MTQATDDNARAGRSRRGYLIAAVAILLVGAGAVWVLRAASASASAQRERLPVLGHMPSFSLTDQAGKPVAPADFRGHVAIADFIFTRCQSLCPISSRRMMRIQHKTADLGTKLDLISFSVDPTYDTPPRLAAYARSYHANPTRWRFLTGKLATMKRVVTDELKLNMSRDGTRPNGVPQITHSARFVLFDRQGRIRGYYDSTDMSRLKALVRDARALVNGTAAVKQN